MRSLKKVLKTVAGTTPAGTYNQLLAQRLARGKFRNEGDWVASCVLSGVPDLALEAIKAGAEDKDGAICRAECELMTDRSVRADVRTSAIESVGRKKERQGLLALCEVLDDPSPAFTRDCWAAFRPNYPFADRLDVKTLQPFVERWVKQCPDASQTIGAKAREQLKKAAGRDVGKDRAAWQKWVLANARQPRQE